MIPCGVNSDYQIIHISFQSLKMIPFGFDYLTYFVKHIEYNINNVVNMKTNLVVNVTTIDVQNEINFFPLCRSTFFCFLFDNVPNEILNVLHSLFTITVNELISNDVNLC